MEYGAVAADDDDKISPADDGHEPRLVHVLRYDAALLGVEYGAYRCFMTGIFKQAAKVKRDFKLGIAIWIGTQDNQLSHNRSFQRHST